MIAAGVDIYIELICLRHEVESSATDSSSDALWVVTISTWF
jgi:hypothetical protein